MLSTKTENKITVQQTHLIRGTANHGFIYLWKNYRGSPHASRCSSFTYLQSHLHDTEQVTPAWMSYLTAT